MKSAQITSIAVLFGSAMAGAINKRTGYVQNVDNPPVANSVPDSAASCFKDDKSPNLLYSPTGTSEDKSVIPDNVFVVQCLEQGFRGDCMVLGAPPGQCGMHPRANSH
jgi:hypothetical protein